MVRKALFLDRDGVINVDKGYVWRIGDFEFIRGIFDLCKAAQELTYKLIVVTNQAGIGRGYYTENDYNTLTQWMTRRFEEQGVYLSKIFHCPYHPIYGVGIYKRSSLDRKPQPGMIMRASNEFDLDLAGCVLVGDNESDIVAGATAGVGLKALYCAGPNCGKVPTQADIILQSLTDLIPRL